MGKQETPEEKKELTQYEKIRLGLEKPEGKQKGWLNLEKRIPFNQMPEEKRREICRKGQKAMMELHGKKKTARDALKNVLTLKVTEDIIADADIDPAIAERLKRDNPDATLYDLIHAVAVGKALGGNVKAMEYVRDTHGDKPIDRVEVTENVTTDSDRELMRQIADRLSNAEAVHIVESTPTDVKTENP